MPLLGFPVIFRALVNVDEPLREIDVAPPERLHLAKAQPAGVEDREQHMLNWVTLGEESADLLVRIDLGVTLTIFRGIASHEDIMVVLTEELPQVQELVPAGMVAVSRLFKVGVDEAQDIHPLDVFNIFGSCLFTIGVEELLKRQSLDIVAVP